MNVLDLFNAKMLFEPDKRIIMVIGASDTGKTTLIMSLATLLSERFSTAIVDLDMGQSHIGPPTTVGWGKVDGPIKDWSMIDLRDFYFTGTVTPFGSLVPSITGAKIITEKALRSAEKVIIDTTGLISEPAGRVLKNFKIDIIRPDVIIALESSGELSHILDPFRFNRRPQIIRIHVSPEVKVKTQTKRAEYRFLKMMDYLRQSQTVYISIDKVGIRFIRNTINFEEIMDRVVSLRDSNNEDIALGVIKSIKDKRLKIFTPLKDIERVSSIIIGRAVMDMKNKALMDCHNDNCPKIARKG